jgi:hypothetical protein
MLGWVGCGDPGAATTARIDGTVTLDGAPVPNALIAFNPAAGSKTAGRLANGKSDASGKFSVSSFKANDGAMPGSYVVTVDGEGVPDKYKAPDKSDLKVTVEAGKTNTVKLDMKKGE